MIPICVPKQEERRFAEKVDQAANPSRVQSLILQIVIGE